MSSLPTAHSELKPNLEREYHVIRMTKGTSARRRVMGEKVAIVTAGGSVWALKPHVD